MKLTQKPTGQPLLGKGRRDDDDDM